MYQSWEFYGWFFFISSNKRLKRIKWLVVWTFFRDMCEYITHHIDNHFSIWVIGYGDWHASMVLLRIIMDVIKEVNLIDREKLFL